MSHNKTKNNGRTSCASNSTAIYDEEIRAIADGMNLEGIMAVCGRLSLRNKAILKTFVEGLITKELETVERLLAVEEELAA